ncbi:MAG: peptidoglycan DD-metalloendopeptidase family protein [Candidatus Latescibacteria bacterium]|nr:peptidoglycan DD-metalloendopeptidase family protein [Candidatus Latescibacterota bacterium]
MHSVIFADNNSREGDSLLKSSRLPAFWFWSATVVLLVILVRLANRDSDAALTPADQATTALLVPLNQTAAEQTADSAFFVGPQPPDQATALTPEPQAQTGHFFVGPLPQSAADWSDHEVGPLPQSALTRTIRDTLGRDDSIYLSLKRHRLAEQDIAQLTVALQSVFDVKRSRPGDSYQISLDTAGVISSFHYAVQRQPARPIVVDRRGDRLVANRVELPLQRRLEVLSTRLEDNLYNAINNAGAGPEIFSQLSEDIFGAIIDFRRDPRQGDRIGLVLEKYYLDDRFIRYGRILLAEYAGRRVSQEAVFYQTPQGDKGYYDSKGKSLQRPFLIYPLNLSKIGQVRISSKFNRKRFHPILKKTVPHLGTDYAAPRGTPVWATAAGKVIYAATKGSFGKLVEIEHANGYRTRYAHLSSIGVKHGQYVNQHTTVGRVGSTGRATGPHLHYELIKDGRHQNPERINKGIKAKPLDTRYAQAFAAHRDSLRHYFTAPPVDDSEQDGVLAAATAR